MAATGRRYVETGSPGYVVRPKTPIEPADTKKPGVIREKFRSATLAISWSLGNDKVGKEVKVVTVSQELRQSKCAPNMSRHSAVGSISVSPSQVDKIEITGDRVEIK